MGKKKGGKSETNGDVEDTLSDIENSAPKETGKKSKKGKKKNEDWEDDISKDLEDMTLAELGGKKEAEHEEPVEKEKKKEKKSKKAAKKDSDESEEEIIIKPKMGGGFAALMDDSDGDLMDDDDDDEPVVEEKSKKDNKKKKKKEEEEPLQVVEEEKGKKGKKKKGKKKGADDEEDLDKILAELESEYKGEKPKEEKEEPKNDEVKDAEMIVEPTEEETGKKKKKKKKEQSEEMPVEVDAAENEEVQQDKGDEEKKEESKAKKKKKKAKDAPETTEKTEPVIAKEDGEEHEEEGEGDGEGESSSKKKKKKKKGDKDEEEDPKAKKTKPNKKMLAAMKEILAKQKEQEEKLKAEEEERIRKEEERIQKIEEEKRLEQERKDRKKQKEKERKERLKAEGKLLTPKQKQDLRRAQGLLEHLKAQGVSLPEAGEKRPRPGTRVRPKKPRKEEKTEEQDSAELGSSEPVAEEGTEKGDEVTESWDKEEEEEEVKDAWDESDDEEDDEDTSEATKTSLDDTKKSEKDDYDGDDDSDEESESDDSEKERQTEAEKRKQRALLRIAKRKELNEKNLDPNTLRAPVVCVLGHVDHGKTKILDKLRRTNVQEGEVGGITQQIGATNVPAHGVQRQTHMVKDFDMNKLNFPGLLIIDTPGHESFSNLRMRGSSLCDIAILVVDITQGLEPQTVESINLLKKRKTPFIVALNKVDRVFEWESNASKDIQEVIKLQKEPSKNDFERRTSEIIQALNVQALNAALFWENPDPRSYVSLVPTSAISGDGMGNLIALICEMCQQRLNKRLMFSEELQCTVLEVKTIQGHGTTIDVILVNGRLHEGDTIILAGTEGPIVTQIRTPFLGALAAPRLHYFQWQGDNGLLLSEIFKETVLSMIQPHQRSLLLPKPLKEIRVKGQYDEFKEVAAAQGVKIAARDLEKAIAGLNLLVAYHEDELDFLKEEVDKEFNAAMRSIKVKERGVYVQASTLGALEALLEFFKANKVPYSGIRVGPVVKKDVMRAAAMLEHDPMYAVILAFDVKVEKDAQDLADKEGVKIFSEETIYHLGDRYVEYIKEYKKKKQDEFRSVAVFPCRLKIIPTAIFNKRDPIVLGVTVDTGLLRTGTPLCVPSKEFVEIGIVTSMEFDHKNVDLAKKGVDVCIKIEPVPGSTPKLFGRHFEGDDVLVSKISRESIDACKDHFRDDLSKTDWKLMAELKKEFQIL